MERKNAWLEYKPEEIEQVHELSERYRSYLDAGKTERECVNESIRLAKAAGFADLNELIAQGKQIKPGDRFFTACMGKSIALFVMGKEPIEKGMRIIGAHIDSPRIDVKQNPVYEESDLCYFDTHYYGGIKKFHWVGMPLALHGVVAKKDGSVVTIIIGEKADDPVFCISDLLIHLSGDQMTQPAGKVIDGEKLDLIVGGQPVKDEDKNSVKKNVLALLKSQYGIEEEDFLSAELEIVPAGNARDMGLDRSMILAYGHDDRCCAFPSLDALLGLEEIPARTCCCLLVDKEEIGSVGATGMQANFFENAVAEIVNLAGDYSELKVRRALANSCMLSCDVSAGLDPLYASAFESKNSAFLGRGVCLNKYTGSRGKGGSNDANAEYIAKLRKVMDDAGVFYQTSELGKVDQGGGGTIAYICALYGMEVIDAGLPVLSMHAPYEVINKADMYESRKAYTAFMKNM